MGGPFVKCEECDFQCGSMSYLKDHMLAKHALESYIASQGLKAIDEPKIPKQKRRRNLLKRPNSQNTPFNCEICTFQTKQLTSLEGHMMVKHVLKERIKTELKKPLKVFKC